LRKRLQKIYFSIPGDLFVKNGRFRLDINARVVDQYVQVLVPLLDHVPGQLRRGKKCQEAGTTALVSSRKLIHQFIGLVHHLRDYHANEWLFSEEGGIHGNKITFEKKLSKIAGSPKAKGLRQKPVAKASSNWLTTTPSLISETLSCKKQTEIRLHPQITSTLYRRSIPSLPVCCMSTVYLNMCISIPQKKPSASSWLK
jgi:hypothetical protein